MSIEGNLEKFNYNNNDKELSKIEIIPKTEQEIVMDSERATKGQVKFYLEEIERIRNLIEEMEMKGKNTKSLEMKLEEYEKLLEKAEKKLKAGHA